MSGQLDQELLVTISSPLGLHARPAAELAKLAGSFQAELSLQKIDTDDSEPADCRSILSLLMLGAPQGTTLKLRASGPDAAAALSEIGRFFADGFNELAGSLTK